ncbi:hypothetical protein MCETHM1_00575 [Flavobacteriaceae bacterium]
MPALTGWHLLYLCKINYFAGVAGAFCAGAF